MLILRQGWHVPWRASRQEAPNWPVLKSLSSSSSSSNEGLAFGLLPLLPFWTNLFRLASPQKRFLVQNRLNTMMQRTVTANENAAGLRKICKTWLATSFQLDNFFSVRNLLIATTTRYFGFFPLARSFLLHRESFNLFLLLGCFLRFFSLQLVRNRPFLNYLRPLFRSESWCSSFHSHENEFRHLRPSSFT